jgi:8-oxo-dGTP pyrophosphatase MutT (NUDIX family)
VVREVYEETGLLAEVGELARVDSARRATTDPTIPTTDLHSVRMVFEGWVPGTSPAPRVVEVDGSTVDARWHPLVAVLDGSVPTTVTVRAALEALAPARRQRLAAYALLTRDDAVLLTRIAGGGFGSGSWTLPGGGVDHGESPRDAVRREVLEETGLPVDVGSLLGVHDLHVTGNAPTGRFEDFHGVHLVFAGTVDPGTDPRVAEDGGTTDAVAWIPVSAIGAGEVEVTDVVTAALAWRP